MRHSAILAADGESLAPHVASPQRRRWSSTWRAFRAPTPDKLGGSFLASGPGSILASAEALTPGSSARDERRAPVTPRSSARDKWSVTVSFETPVRDDWNLTAPSKTPRRDHWNASPSWGLTARDEPSASASCRCRPEAPEPAIQHSARVRHAGAGYDYVESVPEWRTKGMSQPETAATCTIRELGDWCFSRFSEKRPLESLNFSTRFHRFLAKSTSLLVRRSRSSSPDRREGSLKAAFRDGTGVCSPAPGGGYRLRASPPATCSLRGPDPAPLASPP